MKIAFFLGILAGLSFLTGIAAIFGYRLMHVEKIGAAPFQPTTSTLTLRPPTNSIIGHALAIDGAVDFVPATASISSPLQPDDTILPGDQFETDATSSATLGFGSAFQISLQPSTSLVYEHGLPSGFLLAQESGVAEYRVNENGQHLSVVSKKILFDLQSGFATISADLSTGLHIAMHGEGTVAFVDKNSSSSAHFLTASQSATIHAGKITITTE